MTRTQKIEAGRIWQVYPSGKYKAVNVLFEGSKTACLRYIQANYRLRNWRRGKAGVSLGKVIWEIQ